MSSITPGYAFSAITAVATDSAVGTSSLRMTGGQKIIEDSFGRLLVVYVDSAGRLALRVSNGDPTQTSAWDLIAKSPTPTVVYDRPAAVLLNSNNLRIVAEGGTGSGRLVDVSVTLVRDGGGSITAATFGTPFVLDNSGYAAFPAAILAHDGSIIVVWNARQSGVFSKVNSLRWDQQNGWRAASNPSSSLPESVIVDTRNTEKIYPNLIERPDNFKVHVVGDRGASSSETNLVYNSATFDGSKWNWGVQNLAYVTSASRGLHDATDLVWDPVRSLVLIVFDITEKNIYAVRGLDSQDRTTVMDTPDLPITNNEWGTLQVHPQKGDYYLFMLDTPTGGSSNYGKLKYATRSGGAWSSTLTTIDSDTNNYGIATKKNPRTGIDILYGKGTTAPATIKFVRIMVSGGNTPPVLNVPGPQTVREGSELTFTVSASDSNYSQTITLSSVQLPSGATFQTAMGNPVSGTLSWVPREDQGPGDFTATFRATDNGNPSLSSTSSVNIRVYEIHGMAVIVGSMGSIFEFDGAVLNKLDASTTNELLEVEWRHDHVYALIVGTGGTMIKYDGISVQSIPTGTTSVLYSVSWTPDDSEALITGARGLVLRYDGQTVIRVNTGIREPIYKVEWSPDGTSALLSGRHGFVARFDGSTFSRIPSGTTAALYAVGWHPSGSYALIGGASGKLFRYDGNLVEIDTSGLFGARTVRGITFNQLTGVGLITGDNGLVAIYDQGNLTRIRDYMDLNGNTASLDNIGNLHLADWVQGTEVAYVVGTNGTIARITVTQVILISKGTTGVTFKDIDWR